MRFHRSVIASFAAGAIAVLAIGSVTFAQRDSSGNDPQQIPGDKTASGYSATRDVEGTRVIRFASSNTPVNEMEQFYLTVDQEIDVTTMVVQNGYFASGTGTTAGISIVQDGAFLYFTTSGFETQSINFPTPLKLREGDRVEIYKSVDTPGSTYVQVQLYGTPPTSSKMVIK